MPFGALKAANTWKKKGQARLREKISAAERELLQKIVQDDRFKSGQDLHAKLLENFFNPVSELASEEDAESAEEGAEKEKEKEKEAEKEKEKDKEKARPTVSFGSRKSMLEIIPAEKTTRDFLLEFGTHCIRLCLEAWDVEKSSWKLTSLKAANEKLEKDKSEAHKCYMQELSALRDRIYRLERKGPAADFDLTKDDLIFYEPMQYLSDAHREMVKDVVVYKMRAEIAKTCAEVEDASDKTADLVKENEQKEKQIKELEERLADAMFEVNLLEEAQKEKDKAGIAAQGGGGHRKEDEPTPAKDMNKRASTTDGLNMPETDMNEGGQAANRGKSRRAQMMEAMEADKAAKSVSQEGQESTSPAMLGLMSPEEVREKQKKAKKLKVQIAEAKGLFRELQGQIAELGGGSKARKSTKPDGSGGADASGDAAGTGAGEEKAPKASKEQVQQRKKMEEQLKKTNKRIAELEEELERFKDVDDGIDLVDCGVGPGPGYGDDEFHGGAEGSAEVAGGAGGARARGAGGAGAAGSGNASGGKAGNKRSRAGGAGGEGADDSPRDSEHSDTLEPGVAGDRSSRGRSSPARGGNASNSSASRGGNASNLQETVLDSSGRPVVLDSSGRPVPQTQAAGGPGASQPLLSTLAQEATRAENIDSFEPGSSPSRGQQPHKGQKAASKRDRSRRGAGGGRDDDDDDDETEHSPNLENALEQHIKRNKAKGRSHGGIERRESMESDVSEAGVTEATKQILGDLDDDIQRVHDLKTNEDDPTEIAARMRGKVKLVEKQLHRTAKLRNKEKAMLLSGAEGGDAATGGDGATGGTGGGNSIKIRKLNEEIDELRDKNSNLEISVQELQQKVKDMKAALTEAGMGEQAEKIFERVGLAPVVKKGPTICVFDRLYNDALHRVKRGPEIKALTKTQHAEALLSTLKKIYKPHRESMTVTQLVPPAEPLSPTSAGSTGTFEPLSPGLFDSANSSFSSRRANSTMQRSNTVTSMQDAMDQGSIPIEMLNSLKCCTCGGYKLDAGQGAEPLSAPERSSSTAAFNSERPAPLGIVSSSSLRAGGQQVGSMSAFLADRVQAPPPLDTSLVRSRTPLMTKPTTPTTPLLPAGDDSSSLFSRQRTLKPSVSFGGSEDMSGSIDMIRGKSMLEMPDLSPSVRAPPKSPGGADAPKTSPLADVMNASDQPHLHVTAMATSSSAPELTAGLVSALKSPTKQRPPSSPVSFRLPNSSPGALQLAGAAATSMTPPASAGSPSRPSSQSDFVGSSSIGAGRRRDDDLSIGQMNALPTRAGQQLDAGRTKSTLIDLSKQDLARDKRVMFPLSSLHGGDPDEAMNQLDPLRPAFGSAFPKSFSAPMLQRPAVPGAPASWGWGAGATSNSDKLGGTRDHVGMPAGPRPLLIASAAHIRSQEAGSLPPLASLEGSGIVQPASQEARDVASRERDLPEQAQGSSITDSFLAGLQDSRTVVFTNTGFTGKSSTIVGSSGRTQTAKSAEKGARSLPSAQGESAHSDVEPSPESRSIVHVAGFAPDDHQRALRRNEHVQARMAPPPKLLMRGQPVSHK